MSSPAPTTTVNKGYGCTKIEVNHYTYEWVIENFKFLPQKNGEYICSPTFRVDENDEVKWSLKLFPNGKNADEEDKLALFLHLNSYGDTKSKITVLFDLSILISEQEKCKQSFIFTYETKTGYGVHEIIKRSKLLKSCGSNDSIMIRCKMHIPQRTITKASNPVSFDSQKGQMNEDFSLFLEDLRFSDVTIIVGDEKFTAHKVVLAARSSVFAAMFEHKEMEENRKNEVNIEDMEQATVRGMLEFIYTDEVTNLETLAPELLRASDKYELNRLRTMCEKVIYETLTINNAVEILILSDLYHADKLKKYVMAFIADHLVSVTQSDSYKRMVTTYPALVSELVYAIAIRKESKE